MKKILIIFFTIIATLTIILIINTKINKHDEKNHTLTYEERVEKYRHARNIIVADKAFSEKERNEMLKKIEENYFPRGDFPRETDNDRREQEKYREIISSFKSETDKIANDKSLSKEEKKRRIGEIIKNFIQKSGN